MKPIFTDTGLFTCQIELDPKSSQYGDLLKAFNCGHTLTIKHSGGTMTGCRVTDMDMNLVDGSVTATAKIEGGYHGAPDKANLSFVEDKTFGHVPDDYSKLEARTLAWLHAGGDPVDMDAKSFYDADKMSKRLSLGERYGGATGRIPNDRIPTGVITGRITGKRARLMAQEISRKIGKQCGLGKLDWSAKTPFVAGSFYTNNTVYAAGREWPRDVTFSDYMAGMSDEFRKAIFGEKSMKDWKFKSVHPQDIDFEELGASVTRQEPLAIVKGSYTTTEVRQRPKRTAAGNYLYADGTVRTPLGELLISESLAADAGAKLDEDAGQVFEDYTATVKHDENYVVVHKSLYDKSLVVAIEPPESRGVYRWRVTQGGGRVYGDIPTGHLRHWVKWAKDVKAAPWHDEDRRKVTFEVNLPTI